MKLGKRIAVNGEPKELLGLEMLWNSLERRRLVADLLCMEMNCGGIVSSRQAAGIAKVGNAEEATDKQGKDLHWK